MARQHFFIVGGQRCGSTMLATRLDQHPQIRMNRPLFPEPKYFLRRVVDITTYLPKYFGESDEAVILGEKSTSYYESQEAARNIHAYFPQAKIIFMLRDPVKRALSNYFFSVENGLESRSLEAVFLEKVPPPHISTPISTDPFAYLERGRYSRYVKMYQDIFGKNQIHVAFLEEMAGNRPWKRMLQFLAVDATIHLEHAADHVNELNWRITDIPEPIFQKLVQYYREEIGALEKLLNKDLDIWRW